LPWISTCNCLQRITVTEEDLEINMDGIKVDEVII